MKITIRPIRPEDAQGIYEIRQLPSVGRQTLKLPSTRIDDAHHIIESLTDRDHQFVAVTPVEDGEKVVGVCGITVFPNIRHRHVAGLGIAVHEDYHGNGIGRQLMEAVLDMADNWLLLERVELTVFPDNQPAISLYQSYGFVKEGIHRNASVRDGKMQDLLTMARLRSEQRPPFVTYKQS